MPEHMTPEMEHDADQKPPLVRLKGVWTIDHAVQIHEMTNAIPPIFATTVVLDCVELERLDTLGASLIAKIAAKLQYDNRNEVSFEGLRPEHRRLIDRVRLEPNQSTLKRPHSTSTLILVLEQIGVASLEALVTLGALLGFLGHTIQRLFGAIWAPGRVKMAPLVHQIEQVGFNALPIIGLISFLIGAVIVNQGAIQLRQFGAEVFVVDLVAVSILKEFGILLTAIMIAGRSGSAFTAQIGSMCLNEEIDAMETMGLNPIDVLVLPRLLALVISLPLLAFFADIMGALGGGLMAWATLDIPPPVFIERFREAVFTTTLAIGIIKAVPFAVVIAITGCFQGMSVHGSAESLGAHTTSSVVQSIFLVILLDALFAVFFSAIGW